jgi:transposase
MDRATNFTAPADRLFCAVELSKNSWLLGIQFPDREKASVYPLKGGDSEGLMAKLVAACDRWTKVSGKKPSIILCYEAGYDAFWLARFLQARGIECLVVDSASMQVNRRSRRAKTDRIDLAKLLRTLTAWCGGERHVWSVVRIPTVDEEDLRRSHRERGRLITERTAHVNRIKGLLFAQGIRGIDVKARYKTLQIDKLVTRRGTAPPTTTCSRDQTRDRAAADRRHRRRARREPDNVQGNREETRPAIAVKRDRSNWVCGHGPRGLLPSVQQPATDRGFSGISYERLRQRPGGALSGDLSCWQRSCAGNHDPDGLAVDQTST